MSIVVVFESMFGNTRQVALSIAEGLAPYAPAVVLNVNESGARAAAEGADLLIVGGPTHVHGMSRPKSREGARDWEKDAAKNVTLEPLAPGIGVREWMGTLEKIPALCAAFDTRVNMARIVSGAASGPIERALVKHGSRNVLPAASFVLAKDGGLEEGELARARAWGASVGEAAGLVARD
ncbi:flavodoxin family protein [Cryobacterium cheniae]|uniref:Flavodoxin family protein n=1 Tax=Cryobacterium cheniae TaxID=1259262 RepID=A0A4R8XTB2_9MICO|nr:flavodoxin family protein [Cryobacterium cheniae]TFC82063.1 flavodoxin family protein [Cryobacterium cheniae]